MKPSIKTVVLGLFLSGLTFARSAEAQGLTIVQVDDPGVSLTQFDPSVHPVFAPLFQQEGWAWLRQHALIVTNDSDLDVVALTVTWSFTDSGGKTSSFKVSSDSFLFSRAPVVRARMEAVVTPSGFYRSIQRSGTIGGRRSPGGRTRLERASSITVSLDAVVFGDGLVVGPDETGTVDSLESRRIAAQTVAQSVRAAIVARRDVSAEISRLLTRPAMNSENILIMRFARSMQTGPTPRTVDDVLLNQLSNLPELPPFYRRVGGQ